MLRIARELPFRASIPTVSTANIAREGFFYVGGHYVGEPGKEVMDGAMYVEVKVPRNIRHPYPIVFVHGGGQTGVDWLQTPDGRPGWAYYFLVKGYLVYIVDTPAQGRSAYVPGVDGPLSAGRTAPELEKIWTDPAELGDWPQAKKDSQWPGSGPNKGKMGDPVFDFFAKMQVSGPGNGVLREKLNQEAGAALLDEIGPAILLGHSNGGPHVWLMADARPKLVKGILAVEPQGPPIEAVYVGTGKSRAWGLTNIPIHYDPPIKDPSELKVVKQDKPEEPDLVPCWRQQEPAHKLVNLESIPVLFVSAEAGYHRLFDHCEAAWLNQAGVKTEFVRLEDVGLRGNDHYMMLEKNSSDIAKSH